LCKLSIGFSVSAFIVIKVEVALEKEFTEELTNKSSPVYQELERNITAEVITDRILLENRHLLDSLRSSARTNI
jgi:hypothetical protein